ncbi:hypothetical protein [Marinobacter sp. ATCH36]|uniref:hypothetical protein n=1 Tax=Marinobacter sp. ATCH36 TaxID=2945106 RepID=UPI0020205BAC|nr:hypothetical protein [Marinobacter sp. ATCH36]MCL7945697.1 hypothetical protein [Marinobacter sp. ATCH36]
MKQMLNPTRDSWFTWQVASYKVLRYAACIPMATLVLAALFLEPVAGLYSLAAIGYVAFLILAWSGHKREVGGQSLPVVYSIPYYFMLLNVASYKACIAVMKGEKTVTWNPRKG